MTDSQSIIGRRMPRPEAVRLAAGRGRYTDDIDVAKLATSHSCAALIRTPASARSNSTAARAAQGVIAVVTGDDLAAICKPWQTHLALLPGHKSPRSIRSHAMKHAGKARPSSPSSRTQELTPRTHWNLSRSHGLNCRRSQLPKPRPRTTRPSPTARCRATLVSSTPSPSAIPMALSAMPPSSWSTISLSDGRPA